jgi:nicotinamide-nucleotide amidase
MEIYQMSDIAVVVEKLKQHNLHIATAESCTGGLIAGAITSISGASDIFNCGIICYSNDIKQNILNVDKDILNNYGAVSYQTAQALALSVQNLAQADIAISTTGIAGPTGGTVNKPIGLVFIALAYNDDCLVEEYHFSGDRQSIREQSVSAAFCLLSKHLNNY